MSIQVLQAIENCGIDSRHYYKTRSFIAKVEQYIQLSGNISDICCGNGLLGLLLSKQANITQIDIKKTNKYKLLREQIPYESEFVQSDIRKNIPKNDLFLAIHACGELTDIIIEKGKEYNIPFAVMPCCEVINPNIQASRRESIRETHQLIHTSINPGLTGKNTIYIGLPIYERNKNKLA